MTTAITTATLPVAAAAPAPSGHRLWRAGILPTVAAAAATTTVAAISRAGDVPVAIEGERIPLAGFATMTILGSVVGVVLATVLQRRARHPRRTFVVTTVLLTALSCVPSLTAEADTATNLTLASTHLVAAAIVIPALASRLALARTATR